MDSPIGVCTAAAPTSDNEFQLFPAGRFNAQDGRPKDAPAWIMTGTIAARLIAAFNARKNPMVVDYEHQTVLTKDNGKPAPAAGWVHGLEWREGKGLFAVGVKWTDAARASIQSDEYRYISPVFHYNRQTGEVIGLLNAALTNNPALDGMESAVALRAQLDEQASQLECLRLEMAKREINDVVQAAYETGRLLPYQLDAARELATVNMDALKVILDRPALLPLRPQTEGLRDQLTGQTGKWCVSNLTAEDLRMCELTGRTPEEFATLKQQFTTESH